MTLKRFHQRKKIHEEMIKTNQQNKPVKGTANVTTPYLRYYYSCNIIVMTVTQDLDYSFR